MKHTKGPWKAHFDGVGTPYYQYNQYVTAPNCGGELIAKVQNMDEAEANAHLIASAPDLLEALEVARGALDYAYFQKGVACFKELQFVESVIAKAEGKE